MALLRLKRNHEQVPHESSDVEDVDILVPEVEFFVNFLGSMIVPTSNGHGSARTGTAVGRIYSEKYKVFSFNSKKYRLQINNDCLALFDCTGKDSRQVDTFHMKDITYCSTDKKYERAFVLVSQEKKGHPYRAFVFHCENSARAQEIFRRVSSTSRVHRNLVEVARMQSLCTDSDTVSRLGRSCSLSDQVIEQGGRTDDANHQFFDVDDNQPFRRRCQSETPKMRNHNIIIPTFENGVSGNGNDRPTTDVWLDTSADDHYQQHTDSSSSIHQDAFDEEDEFTALASDRTKSYQYTGLPHHLAKRVDKPHESVSLMNNSTVDTVEKSALSAALNNLMPFAKPQVKCTPESENLLQF